MKLAVFVNSFYGIIFEHNCVRVLSQFLRFTKEFFPFLPLVNYENEKR